MLIDFREWVIDLVQRHPTAPREVTLWQVLGGAIRTREFLGTGSVVVILLAVVGLIAQWNHPAAPVLVFGFGMLTVLFAAAWVSHVRQSYRQARYCILGVVEVLEVEFPASAATVQTPARGEGPAYCVLNWQVTVPNETFYEGPITLVRGDRIFPWVDQPGARMEALIDLDPRDRGVWYGIRPLAPRLAD